MFLVILGQWGWRVKIRKETTTINSGTHTKKGVFTMKKDLADSLLTTISTLLGEMSLDLILTYNIY